MEYIVLFIMWGILAAAMYNLWEECPPDRKGEEEQGSGMQDILQPERRNHPTEGTAEPEKS